MPGPDLKLSHTPPKASNPTALQTPSSAEEGITSPQSHSCENKERLQITFALAGEGGIKARLYLQNLKVKG